VGLPAAERPLGAAVERAHAHEGRLLSWPASAVEGKGQQPSIAKEDGRGIGELPSLEKLRPRKRPDVNGRRRTVSSRHEARRVGRETDGIFGSRRQRVALAAVPVDQEHAGVPAERQPPGVGTPFHASR